MLVIGQMPFCQYELARLPIGNAGIQGTAQSMRNPFLLKTKLFLPSSHRHNKEDAARPSVSQMAAVTRPHLRVSQNKLFCAY